MKELEILLAWEEFYYKNNRFYGTFEDMFYGNVIIHNQQLINIRYKIRYLKQNV